MSKKSKTPPDSSQNTKSDNVPYRLNLTLDEKQRNDLNSLKISTQKASLVDVIRAAIVLLKTIDEHQKSGGKVILRCKDGKDETLIIL